MKPFSELIDFLRTEKDIYPRRLILMSSVEHETGYSYFTFEYDAVSYNVSIDFKGCDARYLFDDILEHSFDVRSQTGRFVIRGMPKIELDTTQRYVDASNQLIDEIETLFERYSHEADLTYCHLLGVMEICKWNILGKLPNSKD